MNPSVRNNSNVYFANCTADDTYNNKAACPREYTLEDQQWVGMVRCFVSNNKTKEDEICQGCLESVQPLNNIGDACRCTTGLLGGLYTKAAPDFPREALLPTAGGGRPITFVSGRGPSNTAITATSRVNLTELTIVPSPATPASGWSTLGVNATKTGNGGVPYSRSPGTTQTNTPAGGGDGGLSPGAKAGIGVGAALGGIALISILWCLFLLNRRLARGNPRLPPVPAPITPMSPAPGYQHDYVQPVADSAKPHHATPALAHPSELEGSHYQLSGAEGNGQKADRAGGRKRWRIRGPAGTGHSEPRVAIAMPQSGL